MKKRYILSALLLGAIISESKGQAVLDMRKNTSENDVTVTMDLQPILELQMTTPSQIDFVFDNINAYMAGITKYGATVLRVSSTVDWDLVAVGSSGRFETGGNLSPFWDNPVQYKTPTATSITTIPLSSLELQQTPANPATGPVLVHDYSSVFATYTGGIVQASNNSVEVGDQALSPNGVTLRNYPATGISVAANDAKNIAGQVGVTSGGNVGSITPGSYLNTRGAGYAANNFKYNISYRILPGLPAIFPMRDVAEFTTPIVTAVGNVANSYANPGVYTMEVRYILTEDQ